MGFGESGRSPWVSEWIDLGCLGWRELWVRIERERGVSSEECEKDRLTLLLRYLGPGVSSAWVLKGIWEPEQQLGAQPASLGMREARGTSGNSRKEAQLGLVVRDFLACGGGGAIVGR